MYVLTIVKLENYTVVPLLVSSHSHTFKCQKNTQSIITYSFCDPFCWTNRGVKCSQWM